MLKCEMTLKEVYDSVILDNYNIALRSIKVLQGPVSLEDMIKENERRGYEYLQ